MVHLEARRVPDARLWAANRAPVRPEREFVLYWMTAARRTRYNFGLQRAVTLARSLGKPLVVLEALRLDYPWASARFHRFVIDGMADNKRHLESAGITYYPYIEPGHGSGKGLLAALARCSCCVVTDDCPAFFLPAAVAAAARQLDVSLEAVDSNGLLPMRNPAREFSSAHAFRRYLQSVLPAHLLEFPAEDPLKGEGVAGAVIPSAILQRWPPARTDAESIDGVLGALPIDQRVRPTGLRGGYAAAVARLRAFVEERLPAYADDRSHPDADAGSGLSPYLHFGHVSIHEVFDCVARSERWSPGSVSPRATGARAGWWGMSGSAEAFLDEAITWRELGLNACVSRTDYGEYEAIPGWARETLERHAEDEREYTYRLQDFEEARTHDSVWNAAQVQLLTEGRIHNYMRMLWGKKILEWSETPREALAIMTELNNKYALDGRDPNSYTGILWVLGKYDRPWAPERPVFGTVRYMSSENTLRKLRAREYLNRYAP